MTLDNFKDKLESHKENNILNTQIEETLELFADLTNLNEVTYYRYEYEYNNFFHKFTIDANGNKLEEPSHENQKYKIVLKKDKLIYGYVSINRKIKSSSIVKKILKKLLKYLEKQKDLEKSLLGSDVSFNIYLIHDNSLNMFAQNLKTGLEGLFNVDVILDDSIEKHLSTIKDKETKHIIVYLIDDDENIRKHESVIKVLNELIIVIGPNDHKLSMYCGKLGIQNYLSINEFRAETIKEIILDTRNHLLNKNKYGNKIIALSGIAGGIGTTTIGMNMSDILSQKLPDKNILYIDLSTTKAVSNLFLQNNPLPQKTIVDLINTSEFHLENNLQNGLCKVRENFYFITGIQKHIDNEYLEKDVFIEKLLEYISSSSDYFNFIIIDTGISDASNLKTTIYDIVNEIWIISEMNLPHISKLKTFYSLMKRAGLKEKISFMFNRYDSENTISINDVVSILNVSNDDKIRFDEYKIPNDYKTLGKCWNFCELASSSAEDSLFIEKLKDILIKKEFYKVENEKDSRGFFASLFKKSK